MVEFSRKHSHLKKQLEENIALLEHSLRSLNYSKNKCENIKLKDSYSEEDLESLEAMTARFARTSDILTQKVFKGLFLFLQEKPLTFIDSANFLEKIGIIEGAKDILRIRELRNEIAHEYSTFDLNEIFKNTLGQIDKLGVIVGNVKEFLLERGGIIAT